MPGYANRTVRLTFEDLSEPEDLIHVVIKNPKIVPLDELQPADIHLGADGEPEEGDARTAMYKVIAGLVKAWHVYDATGGTGNGEGDAYDETNDDQELLPLPATAASVAKLPWDIIKAVLARIKEVTDPS